MTETTTKGGKDAPAPQAVTYALNPAQLQVGTANQAGMYVAPVGTAPPADTKTPWATPWLILGYMSADGPKLGQTTDTNEIIPWQSMVPLRTVITKRALTMQFVMWQLNDQTLAMYFDTPPPTPSVTDGSLNFDVRTDTPQQLYAIGVDSLDVNQALRIIFPRASLSAAGDMAIKRGEAVPLDVTLSALDSSGVLAHVLLGPGS
jgi:hypothetical protein